MDPMDAALALAKAKQPTQQHERAHKEAVRSLITAKRGVSYVQLALDLRRSQSAKLEIFAARRVSTLKLAEETLAADTKKFDSFLKRNDEEVQAAVQASDLQTKIRQDKAIELKAQNGILAGVKSEVNRLDDALEECVVYRTFLDELTPLLWLQEVKEARAAAKAARIEAWQLVCAAVLAERDAAAEAVALQDAARTNARSQQQYDRATVALDAAQSRLHAADSTREPAAPEDPAEELAEPRYFTQPDRLSQELQKIEVANEALRMQIQTAREERVAAQAADEQRLAELSAEADLLGIEFAHLQAEALAARRASKSISAMPGISSSGARRTSSSRDTKSSSKKGGARTLASGGNNRSSETGSIASPRDKSRGLTGSKVSSPR